MKQRFLLLTSVVLLSALVSSDVMGQWVQTNGPYGGRISSLATIGPNVFAAAGDGYSQKLFLSTNNGMDWKQLVTPWGSETGSLMVSGTTLYVTSRRGLYWTTDNGLDWTKTADSGLGFVSLSSFAVIGSTLFGADGAYTYTPSAGIYRSTDKGASWAATGAGLSNNHVHALIVSGGNLFAGTSQGICLSNDNGTNWRLVDSGLSYTYITSLAVIPGDSAVSRGPTLFATAAGRGILRSTDDGARWTVLDSGADILGVVGTDIFAKTRAGIVRSTDFGRTWLNANTGLANGIYPTTFVASNTNLFIGTDSGVYFSTDRGANWTNVTSNMISRGANTLAAHGARLYTAMDGGGIYVSTDDGANWQVDRSGLQAAPFDIEESGSNLIAATSAGLYLSTNDGARWTPSADSAAGWPYGCQAFAMNGSNLFISNGSHGVYRSTDNGAHWAKADSGLIMTHWYSDSLYVYSLAAIGTTVFAGTELNGVFRSTNNGISWSPVNNGISEYLTVRSMQSIGQTLFVTASDTTGPDNVYRSNDNGASWQSITAGFPALRRTQTFALSGKNIFAITGSDSVLLSTDNGTTWAAFDGGPMHGPIQTIAIKGNNLFAGTAYDGIWRRPLADMIPLNAVATVPLAGASIAAYPNPFAHSTSIAFQSPGGYVEVSIVNLLGQEVARPFEGEISTEEHSVTWDAGALTAGTYWCEVRVNGQVWRYAIVLSK